MAAKKRNPKMTKMGRAKKLSGDFISNTPDKTQANTVITRRKDEELAWKPHEEDREEDFPFIE